MKKRALEWPTIGLIGFVYLCWAILLHYSENVPIWLLLPLLSILIAQHSSLQHEVLHGHPFPQHQWLNELLVFPAIGLFIPYGRFRDTHLSHHLDARLTDPYDDPETNYVDPKTWQRYTPFIQKILRFNNTLAGRMVLGPMISQISFMRSDARAIWTGDLVILRQWLIHIISASAVLFLVYQTGLSISHYVLCAYFGLSLLKIRTFLEHRAHDAAAGRTVVVEDKGPLAVLFLNNNYHAVHHAHPKLPWYKLPQKFNEGRQLYLERNRGYYYRNYGEIFRKYSFVRKDDVPHPLYPWKDTPRDE